MVAVNPLAVGWEGKLQFGPCGMKLGTGTVKCVVDEAPRESIAVIVIGGMVWKLVVG
jgi:hypothetical protein